MSFLNSEAYLHIYTYYIYIYTYIYIKICTYTCTYIYIYTYTCTYIYIHTHIDIFIYIYIYIHIYIHIYTLTHINTHKSSASFDTWNKMTPYTWNEVLLTNYWEIWLVEWHRRRWGMPKRRRSLMVYFISYRLNIMHIHECIYIII